MKEGKPLLYAAFDNLLEGCQIIGFNWEYIYLNNAAVLHAHRPKEELLGKKFMDVWPESRPTELFRILKNCLENRIPQNIENRFEYQDGTESWFELRIQPVPEGVFVLSVDITELMQAKGTLETQHTLLTNLINSANNIIIFSLDKEYCYTAFNELHRAEMKKVWNADIEIGMNLLDCMKIPGLRALAKKSIDRVLQGESFLEVQVQPDAGIYYEISWNTIFQNHEISGVSVFISDITENRLAEESLRVSEEKFRNIFENSRVGKSLTILDGKMNTNAAFREILGYPESELAQLKWQTITHPDDVERDQKIIDSMVSGEYNTFRWEKRYIHKKGHTVWVDISATLQRDREGKPLYFITTINDITGHKLADEALKKSEERYRSLLENLDAGIVVHAPDSSIKMNNQRASVLLGLSPLQLKGKLAIDPDWKFIDENNIPLQPEAYPVNRIITGRKPVSHLILGVVQPATEKIVWLSVNGFPVFDNRGEMEEVLISFIDITDRILAEQALRETNAYLDNLIDYANAPIIVWDPQLRITRFNHAFESITGRRAAEVLGQSLEILFPPAQKAGSMKLIRKTMTGERWETVEIRILHLNGSIRTLLWNSATLFMPDGLTPIATIAQGHDITERELAEEAFRLKNLVFDASIAANSIADHHGLITEANEAFLRIWGYPDRDEVIGRSLSDFICNPDDATAIINALNEQNEWAGEYLARRKDGSVFTAYGMATTILDVTKKLIGYQSAVIDITRRRKAEEALRIDALRLHNFHMLDQAILKGLESIEEIVQTALRHIRSILFCQRASIGILDAENRLMRIFVVNSEVGTISHTGISLNEEFYIDLKILQQNRMEIIEDITMIPEPPALLRILQAEGVRSCINVPLMKEDQLIGAMVLGWEDVSSFTPDQFEIAGEVASHVTISIEQVRLRQNARQYAAELEITVKERTASLLASNKELEAFSYSISHDLRAPLRAIHGFTEILIEDYAGKLDDEGRRICSVIRDNSVKLGMLIDDLLAFSRLGRTEMKHSVIDIKKMVSNLFQELTDPDSRKRIKLTVEDICEIRADQTLIRQVWTNLLSNALKFSSKKEEAVISISSEKGAGRCTYCIRDNGAGFDMKYVEKIFGVFQRLHSEKEFEGTGVGLAIVKRIVNRHGGEVWAEGEVGKGAAFYFSLPFVDA